MSHSSCPLRLLEAAGVMSLATDLAMGQPLEHGLRTAIMALRMAQAMGLARGRAGHGLLHRRAALRGLHGGERDRRPVLRRRTRGEAADAGDHDGLAARADRDGDARRARRQRAHDQGRADGQVRLRRRRRVPQVGGQPLRRGPRARRQDGLLRADPDARCGTCTSAGTARACQATCVAIRSRWPSG